MLNSEQERKEKMLQGYHQLCQRAWVIWQDSVRSGEVKSEQVGIVVGYMPPPKEGEYDEFFTVQVEPVLNQGMLISVKHMTRTMRGFCTANDPMAYDTAVRPVIRNLFKIAFPYTKDWLGQGGA